MIRSAGQFSAKLPCVVDISLPLATHCQLLPRHDLARQGKDEDNGPQSLTRHFLSSLRLSHSRYLEVSLSLPLGYPWDHVQLAK